MKIYKIKINFWLKNNKFKNKFKTLIRIKIIYSNLFNSFIMYLYFNKIFIIFIMYYFNGKTEIFKINSNQLDILDGYLFNRINDQ